MIDCQRLAQNIKDTLRQWRRHLHAHPELGFKEIQAKQMVEQALKKNSALTKEGTKVEDIIKHALQAGQ